MALKPKPVAQLSSQTGLSRQGGIASKMSSPSVMKGSSGSGFSAMENTLLKGTSPDPKALSGGGPGRQFFTQASGGDTGGVMKTPKAFGSRSAPKANYGVIKDNTFKSSNVFSKREK